MFKIYRKEVFLYSLLLSIILVLSGTLSAQNNVGSIVGTVKDQTDALIPNAKVTVTNNATGNIREITSNDVGEFTVTNLEPGNYSIRIESAGFKAILLSAVTVETNARVPINVKFTEVSGTGDNVVNVTADSAPLVESETSVRGDIITGREVVDLPIPQRNFTLLAGLSPGVTRPSAASVGVIGGDTVLMVEVVLQQNQPASENQAVL